MLSPLISNQDVGHITRQLELRLVLLKELKVKHSGNLTKILEF